MQKKKTLVSDPKENARAWLDENSTKRRPTINDIAKIAGVSKRTISRIVNKSPDVRERTREEVRQIIEIVGFKPDPQARGLAFRHSYLVGMIYGNPNPDFVLNLQQGILDGLAHTDYELVVHPTDRRTLNYLDKARTFIQRQKLRGVVLTPSIAEDESFAAMMREIGCHYVRIAPVSLDDDKRMIVTHDRKGAHMVALHLSSLGHERIGFIAGRQDFLTGTERHDGFKAGLEACGLTLPTTYVAQGDFTFQSGVKAAEQLLSLTPHPTAIFAANDEMAAGALLAIRMAGLRAPDNVSVVGFDDFHIAETVWPRLTTLHSPTRKIGQMAALRLLEDKTCDLEIPEPRLVVRESSAELSKQNEP